MKYSESTKNLLAALRKFQDEVGPIVKDGKNPHFKSHYATLDGCLHTAQPILSKHGLVITQPTSFTEGITVLHTRLSHVTSGEFMEADWPLLPSKNDPQGLGSANTYGRRYSVLNVLGLAPEDDDGNAASHVKPPVVTVTHVSAPSKAYIQRQETAEESDAGNPGGDYTIPFGKYKGMKLGNINSEDIESYCEFLVKKGREDGKPRSENMKAFYAAIDRYLGTHFVALSTPQTMEQAVQGLDMNEVPF